MFAVCRSSWAEDFEVAGWLFVGDVRETSSMYVWAWPRLFKIARCALAPSALAIWSSAGQPERSEDQHHCKKHLETESEIDMPL